MVELQDTFKSGCAPKDHEDGLNIKLRNLLLKQIKKKAIGVDCMQNELLKNVNV